jgi:hypothetical protein
MTIRAAVLGLFGVGLVDVACIREPRSLVVSVRDGRFAVKTADGAILLNPSDLVGAELSIRNHLDVATRIRIDGIIEDPVAVDRSAVLYDVSRFDGAAGRWVPYCDGGQSGAAYALPVQGRWDRSGRAFTVDSDDFTVTCTSGANGKCVRMGYVPGRTTDAGESLTPYFEACVRMMRADYCGDGQSYTEPGISILLADRLGVAPRSTDPTLGFEAAWGPQGAVCVRRPRILEKVTLEALAERCVRLRGNLGEACGEDRADALIVNWSPEAASAP